MYSYIVFHFIVSIITGEKGQPRTFKQEISVKVGTLILLSSKVILFGRFFNIENTQVENNNPPKISKSLLFLIFVYVILLFLFLNTTFV